MGNPTTVLIDSIDKVYVKNSFELTRPITNISIVREGTTVSVDIDTIEGTLLEKDQSVWRLRVVTLLIRRFLQRQCIQSSISGQSVLENHSSPKC